MDDIQVGVKSTALKFGDQSKLWLMTFATGVSGGLALSGAMCQQPWLYFAGVGIVTSHLAYQVMIKVTTSIIPCTQRQCKNSQLF